jgi:hypothetical protein
MKNIFTEHPTSIGESYFQHMKFAGLFGCKMLIGGLACLIHAVFPFLFISTGSNLLLKMTHHFIERMPRIEGKVAELSRVIDSKKVNHS